ncbi:sphingomyelin phosphodiesterase-like [Chironomus tepperi]|uniref:sphingomyelin phosphodiesterase-like n=1 Tax=Chironomus tepperi TaxID=113505 RepID=UPI00391F6B94
MDKLLKLGILLLCTLCCASAHRIRTEQEIANRDNMLKHVDTFADLFASEYTNYTITGIKTPELEGMLKMMQIPREFLFQEVGDMDADAAIMTCVACRSTFALMLNQYRTGQRDREQLTQDSITLCLQLTSYSIIVCEGAVRKYADIILFIVDSRPSLTANQMCSIVLAPDCGDPDPIYDFTINVSPGLPITGPKTVFTPRNSNEMKILHFTDIHYDPNYLVGGQANCADPICCRRANGIAPNPEDRAGQWGDYRACGTPWQSVENAIRSAHAQHPDADMVYVTGDYVDHGIWETTQAGNTQIFDRLYAMFRTVFGNKPVFIVLGNHEANPTNQFAPPHITDPSLSTHWLYQHAATAWSQWLPASTQTTIRRGGYYTALSPDSRLRIIGLNNNDCYNLNFWMMYSTDQIAEQLQWFHDTLLAAERAGEMVHVVTHMSSGSSCSRWWSREYRRVIERFHRIIGAQFFGHSHQDDVVVFYARDQHTVAINAGWVGGTITTHSGHSPNYNVYYVDRVHYQVNEKESWSYNLNEANMNPATSPVWRMLYRFTEHFNIPNTSPASLDNFVSNVLSRSRRLLTDYYGFRMSNSPFILARGCDDNCLRHSLCRIVANEVSDTRKCDEIRSFPLT